MIKGITVLCTVQEKVAGGTALDFTAVAAVGAASDLIMRFHGFIMMAAWLGCAGTGMLIARYFKATWKVCMLRTVCHKLNK